MGHRLFEVVFDVALALAAVFDLLAVLLVDLEVAFGAVLVEDFTAGFDVDFEVDLVVP